MKKFFLMSFLVGITLSIAGCGGGNEASVSDDYATSEPRSDPRSGPTGAGGPSGGEKKKESDSSMTAPPPPPL